MTTRAPDPRLTDQDAGVWTTFLRRARQGEIEWLPVVVALIAIWTFFGFADSDFLTSGNLTNLALQMTGVGVIALGVVMVLLLAEIDLSVGVVSGLAASVMAVLNVKHGWPGLWAIVAALVVGLLIGLFHGIMITQFGVPSFVVTLAGLLAWQGVLLYTLGDTGTVNLNDETITDLANTFFSDAVGWIVAAIAVALFAASAIYDRRRRVRSGLRAGPMALLVVRIAIVAGIAFVAIWIFNDDRGLPLSVAIFIALVFLFDFILRRTTFGRHVFAVGGNPEAARRAGISLTRVRITVFMICSLMASIGGVLLASRLFAVNQASGSGDLLLLAIAAAVIGGTSLFGGRGTAYAALLGALVIQSITNGMDLLGVASDVKFMVTGAVLLVAVTFDAIARRERLAAGAG
jgi:D-xylose transport system permease protein